MSAALDNLLSKLYGVKRDGAGYKALCPCHLESTASLHLSDGEHGILAHCFGCGAHAEQVCEKIGMEIGALFFTPRNGSTSPRPQANGRDGDTWREPDISYQIRNAGGALIATHHRFEARDGRQKRLCWQAAGSTKWTLGGLPLAALPLYGTERAGTWPETAGVVLTEGEKACDRLTALGTYAVATVTGAAAIPSDNSLLVLLKFQEVTLWADHDPEGREHMARIGERLLALGMPADKLRWLDASQVEGLQTKGADAADLDNDQVRDALDGAIIPFPREKTEAPEADEDIRPPEFSDDALAIEFADHHAGDLRYVAKETQWREYDGVRWRDDTTLQAFDLARRNNRRIAARARKVLEPKIAAKVCSALTSAKAIAAIVSLARSDRRLASRIEDWDRDPFALNTPLGVVELKTGELREHRAADYMRKLAGAGPAPAGTDCPRWRCFLNRIFAGDAELIGFIQRGSGYSLTGSIGEQVLFFLHGFGANGKSVFVNVMRAVLGDYSTSVPMDALTVTHFQQHPTELTDLQGARFASAIETESGRRWAEARIKALTGSDKIKARHMRQDFFEFDPTHKLWIAGNHRPRLTDVDHAIKRRFLMIPFEVVIPKAEQDQELTNKIIVAELPAVLSWMIEGCLDWQTGGLAPPRKVVDATEEYLTSQDSLAQWIADRCVEDVNKFTAIKDLFADWKDYAEQAHEYVGTQRGLANRLAERGYKRDRNAAGTARGFQGIGLLNPPRTGSQ